MLTILLTGLSGAGKSTLAEALSQRLQRYHYKVAVIDGDHYRHALHQDLDFSEAGRRENIRRLLLIAAEKQAAECISIVAAINPYEDQRRQARAAGALVVYISCALPVLIHRDSKGLYKRSLLPAGHPDKIDNLSGINDRYDVPQDPDLVINSDTEPVALAAERLFLFVLSKLQD